MSWYLYIAEARTGAYYVGITTNAAERIAKHNGGDGSRMATLQGPFVLRYTSPAFRNKSEARFKEIQVKGWSRSKKQKLISGDWTL